jgi:hypothetical protein
MQTTSLDIPKTKSTDISRCFDSETHKGLLSNDHLWDKKNKERGIVPMSP